MQYLLIEARSSEELSKKVTEIITFKNDLVLYGSPHVTVYAHDGIVVYKYFQAVASTV